MALDATVRARVDSKLKEDVEEILAEIGLSTSQAITMFLKGVKRERGIPFELKVLDKEMIEKIKKSEGV